MDLLDRFLGHDSWTTRQLLLCCQGLADEQLDQEFDIGHRTVRATFLHIIRNVEVWSDLMAGRSVCADQGEQPQGRSVAGMIARLDRATADLVVIARAVAQRGGWDEHWVDHLDEPPAEKSYGGGIAHVVTHNMHHRAQVLYMLRLLGVRDLPEADVLSWEQKAGMALRLAGSEIKNAGNVRGGNMKIACLGWGSLVWDPRSLHVRDKWFADGPLLPIEFARESKDKRVTLVITPGSPQVRSLWALSSLDSVASAKADLTFREEIKEANVLKSIGVWQRGGDPQTGVDAEIAQWATRLDLDAVVWTKLKPRFSGEERIATADEVITHLRGLSHEQRALAERYVRMAPRQIDTPYRRRLEQEFGWSALGAI